MPASFTNRQDLIIGLYQPTTSSSLVTAQVQIFALLSRFLLQLQRNSQDPTQPDPKVVFHSHEVPLPVPATTSAIPSHEGEKEAKMISFSFNCRPCYQVFLPTIYGPQNYRGNTLIVLRQPLTTSSSVLQLSATGLVLQQCGLAATAKTEPRWQQSCCEPGCAMRRTGLMERICWYAPRVCDPDERNPASKTLFKGLGGRVQRSSRGVKLSSRKGRSCACQPARRFKMVMRLSF